MPGTLVAGGVTTYAAATVSANSQVVSLNGSAHTRTGDTGTTPAPTTTSTTARPVVQVAGSADAAGNVGSAAKQTIGISVLAGPMTISPTTETVALGPNGSGTLSTISVDDARGSLAGWRATVSLQAVSGLDAAQLASTRLCVTPHPTTLVAGNPADVVRSSPRACAGPGDLLSVFFAAPGGGGGEYSDTADIAVTLPGGASVTGPTASIGAHQRRVVGRHGLGLPSIWRPTCLRFLASRDARAGPANTACSGTLRKS